MSSSVLVPVSHDGGMDAYRPRKGGPTPRRSYTPEQKLDHVKAYDAACAGGGGAGGGYLREHGLYSSQLSEWRRLRDAGVLEGGKAGARIGKLTPEQAEIARLRRDLELANRRLARTEAALEIMGKARMLSQDLRESTAHDMKDGGS